MLAYHLNEEVDLSSRSGAFIDRSVEWIVSNLGVGKGTKIADFGCGPGLYTTPLARVGADVTGIDFSKRSIDHARETAAAEGLSIRYINESYLELKLDDRFDLVSMIMCDFCALSPEQRMDDADQTDPAVDARLLSVGTTARTAEISWNRLVPRRPDRSRLTIVRPGPRFYSWTLVSIPGK